MEEDSPSKSEQTPSAAQSTAKSGSLALHKGQPFNHEAEQALLGAVLASNDVQVQIGDFLRPHHFSYEAHGRIYDACERLIARGEKVDAVRLKHLLSEKEDLPSADYIQKLQDSYVSLGGAKDYARTIYDLYLRRELYVAAERMAERTRDFDPDNTAQTQIETAEQELYQLAETGHPGGDLEPFKVPLLETLDQAERAKSRGDSLAGLSTGLIDVDNLLGGLHKSDLVIFAGRPSMGKTALATGIALHVAMNPADSHPSHAREEEQSDAGVSRKGIVAFFSLEMSSEQLAGRILAQLSEVPSDQVRRGRLSSEQYERLVVQSSLLYELPLFVDETPALTIPQIRTRSRRLKRKHGRLDLIVLDYLQLMSTHGRSVADNRVQEVSMITRGLKALAKDLDVPVLALSQLSREVEKRESKRPLLSDLRESGSIEQDADVVGLIFRESYYMERDKPAQREKESDDAYQARLSDWRSKCDRIRKAAELLISKNRHGPTGELMLNFTSTYTCFGNYVKDEVLPAYD